MKQRLASQRPIAAPTLPPSGHHSRLPAQLTSFVGREAEIALARQLLSSTRLLTLTGPGGCGKTRLALAVAECLAEEYADGVAFISLAPIRDPGLVASTVATALGVAPLAEHSPIASVRSHLADKHLLLILDNFEQVVAATSLVADLLRHCPNLTLLVTSRVSLHLSGEQELPVPPLEPPAPRDAQDVERLEQNPAVALFVQRARAINPAFRLTEANAQAVAGICRRLDGLPLAIELAAPRIRLLSPQAIIERLERRLPLLTGGARDLPARQRTMRATIAWSFDLLSEDEQRLFRWLSVFRGGWTLEAAAELSGDDDLAPSHGSGQAVLDELGMLVDHSLVQRGEQPDGAVRFAMLETIREFGLEELEEAGETDVTMRRHADFFATLAAWFETPEVVTSMATAEVWRTGVVAEQDNLRAALAWALDREPETALRIAAGLGPFWFRHDYWAEGRRWLDLSLAGSLTPPLARAHALNHVGTLATWLGDYDTAWARLAEALDLARGLDDWRLIAWALLGLGRVAQHRGDLARAIELYEESLAYYRHFSLDRITDATNKAATVGNLGDIYLSQGRLERASELIEEAVALYRMVGDRQVLLAFRESQGLIALERGDVDEARRIFTECLTAKREYRYSWKMRFAESLEYLALLAAAERQPLRAARLFAAADAIREEIDYRVVVMTVRGFYDRDLAAVRTALGDDAFEAAWAEGWAMPLDDAIDYALSPPEAAGADAEPPSAGAGLSPREFDVLRLLVEGLSDKEIAAALSISPYTVMRHVQNILAKLDVPSRTAAATYAVRHGLV
jgi:non-specific serine/threonine protein kinase